MVFKQIGKHLLVASLAFSAVSLSADIDTTLWEGVTDAFVHIKSMDDHFKASKLVFTRLNDDYSQLYLDFNVYKEKRQAAFACIKTSIHELEGRLDLAIAYKDKVEYDASVEQAALRAHIEEVRIEKNAIIKSLQNEKVSLQSEIDYLKLDLATLEALTGEKVDQALIDIDVAIRNYQAMIAERTVFMSTLDDVLARAAAFEATQTSDITEMSDVCSD